MVRFEDFEKLGLTVAAMSDRTDGDCAMGGPQPGETRRNRQQVCAACGIDLTNLVCARQVHGTRIARITDKDQGQGGAGVSSALPATDGMATDARGLPMAISVADCVPLFLFDPKQHVGALVHAGRKGTFGNIAGQAVSILEERLGSCPSAIHALIGPSAGPCCYEVSAELAGEWTRAGLPARGRHLDLWQANRQQLIAAGVLQDRISTVGACTICSGRYYSFRRNADARRNMALLML